MENQTQERNFEKIYINVHKAYCRIETFYSKQQGDMITVNTMTLPKDSYIRDKNVSGAKFHPHIMGQNPFNEKEMSASYTDKMYVQLELPNGDILKAEPKEIKNILIEQKQHFKKSQELYEQTMGIDKDERNKVEFKKNEASISF